jgi:hypothetical protein
MLEFLALESSTDMHWASLEWAMLEATEDWTVLLLEC